MASIVHEGDGYRLIQLSPSEHPSRPKVRLGKCSSKQAQTVLVHVESLIRAKLGTPIPQETAAWLAGIPPVLRRRLERCGLVQPAERRACPTLGEWLDAYVSGRQDVKDSTVTVYGHTKRNLLAHFGADKRLDEVTPGDADDFAVYLRTTEYLAENTARRRMGTAKQFFRKAVRKRLIASNPFDGQAVTTRENRKRFYFVSEGEAKAILDACPDPAWRLAFALSRYGGLRVPSEVARLT